MSDTELILQLLRRVEWRLRTARLLQDFLLAISVPLATAITLRLWDLFSPLAGTTVTTLTSAGAAIVAGYLIWRFPQRVPLEQAAASIDTKAGLNDEIKTAAWFIRNRRGSVWVDAQIQRAARHAAK